LTDRISKARRSANMARIKGKNTQPEKAVRSIVTALGWRYRLNRKDLPGKPDLALGPARKAIFVHGCFWHQHASKNCREGRLPASNQSYWEPKLARNKLRDRQNLRALRKLGWQVLTVWECELGSREKAERRIKVFLGIPPASPA